ncbi:MAG: metal-dependent transcriptional regulator [Bacilli bacterium]|nr:metal-dependent transcriptional regulator [Bacilli bacterium]
MTLMESGEDYLERILMLQEKNGVVHSIDIAKALKVSKPSVSVAMKKLRENGYIIFNDDESIVLTESGLEVAKTIYERHRVLTRLIIKLGIDEETAERDACKIEHDLSPETFEALKRYYDKESK